MLSLTHDDWKALAAAIERRIDAINAAIDDNLVLNAAPEGEPEPLQREEQQRLMLWLANRLELRELLDDLRRVRT